MRVTMGGVELDVTWPADRIIVVLPWSGGTVTSCVVAFGNGFEAGIIDPAKVTRTALENAASVAGTILLTE